MTDHLEENTGGSAPPVRIIPRTDAQKSADTQPQWSASVPPLGILQRPLNLPPMRNIKDGEGDGEP